MGIISYAQNFEDVMLWRALGHIKGGVYIDVGAHDPLVDSVSKAFYDHGWRGIHLEPLPVYCDALRRDRPDETVLQAAVAAEPGVLRFYEIPDTGISTGDPAIAASHREHGFRVNEITVPCVTLGQVFELVRDAVVHWLKIDVEGLEEQVLQGWGSSALRPWIVVVESTLPMTQNEVYGAWEVLLTAKDYRCVYFDGLNRYYIAAERQELAAAFRCGPNVFDGFQLYGVASNSFTRHVAQRLQHELGSEIASLKQQSEQFRHSEQACATRLDQELARIQHLTQELRAEQMTNLQNQAAARDLLLQYEQRSRTEVQQLLNRLVSSEQARVAEVQLLQAQGLAALSVQAEEFRKDFQQREQFLQQQILEAQRQLALVRSDAEGQRQALHSRIEHLHAERVLAEQQYCQNLLQAQRQLLDARNDSQAREDRLAESARRDLLDARNESQAREDRLTENARHDLAALRSSLEMEAAQHALRAQGLMFELVQIRGSYTWRLTAPLRWLGRYLLPGAAGSIRVDAGVAVAAAEAMTPEIATQLPLIGLDSVEAVDSTGYQDQIQEKLMLTMNQLLAKNGDDFIRNAYQALLRRDADPQGLAYYAHRLAAGYGKRSILVQISKAPERANRHAALLAIPDDREFVAAAYLAVLGRSADPAGLQHYVNFLKSGGKRRKLLGDIEASPEAAFEVELAEIIEQERKANHWLLGWFTQGRRIERHLNRLEYELAYVAESSLALRAESEARFARLEMLLRQAPAPQPADAPVQPEEAPAPVPSHLAKLSPGARQIYRDLVLAIQKKKGVR